MADTKITALTALTAADPINDVIPIVDVSDTSMAASGTTKKISVNNLLSSSPTASGALTITGLVTAGSASVTGNLTVDTNTLFVDSVNDRVGLGTVTPGSPLDLRLATNPVVNNAVPTNALRVFTSAAQAVDVGGQIGLGGLYNATDFQAFANVSGKKENSTNGNNAGYLVFGTCDAFGTIAERYRIGSNGVATWSNVGGIAGTAMTLNATGLGLGVVPSAWGNGFKALELNNACFFANTLVNGNPNIGSNLFYNTSAQPIYKSNGFASAYSQYEAVHYWYNAPSGIAGNVITLTQAMTLNASGSLLVGTTSALPAWATRLTLSTNAGTTKWAVGPYGDATNFIISADGNYGVYLNGTTATSWTAISDERLKDIIEPISNAVAKVGQLRSVIGKFKSDETNTRRSFLVAQDVQAVLPEAVDASNPNRLGVNYTEVIPLLVAAIKELAARVQTLEAR